MLKGINPLFGPDLLHALASMGHGDELVIADRNFPSNRVGQRVVELRGHDATTVATALMEILPLDFALDSPVLRMATAEGPEDVPPVHAEIISAVTPHLNEGQTVGALERFAFYERAEKAFVVIVTGETRAYGDFIISKGVL